MTADDAATGPYEDLLSSIWLYIDWRYVTRQLTTEQKELFADAVDADSARVAAQEGPAYGPPSKAERWWRTDAPGDREGKET